MLDYINVNNRIFPFKNGLNLIVSKENSLRINNIGKTSFIHLLQFIYGQPKKRPVLTNISNRIIGQNKPLKIEWSFIIDNADWTFFYDIKEYDLIKYKEEYITFEEYRNIVNDILDNQIRVIANNFNKDFLFIRQSRDNIRLSDIFNYRSSTYIAMFLLKILLHDEENKSDLTTIENYYKNVAKRNSYRNIRGKYYKDLIEELENASIFKKSRDIKQLKKRLRKLKSVAPDSPNIQIVEEIKQIKLDVPIDKVVEFHNKVVEDYNSIIEIEKLSLKKEIDTLEKRLTDSSINNYDQLDINIATEISEYMNDRLVELKEEYNSVKQTIQNLIDKGNEIISESNELYNNFFHNNTIRSTADNCFVLPPLRNEISETMRFKQLVSNNGNANDEINKLIFNAVVLKNSTVNIVAVDTLHSAEIKDDINGVLEIISNTVEEKQYLMMFFGNEINQSKYSKNIIGKLGAGTDSLLGYDI